jgi:hypothetical protein
MVPELYVMLELFIKVKALILYHAVSGRCFKEWEGGRLAKGELMRAVVSGYCFCLSLRRGAMKSVLFRTFLSLGWMSLMFSLYPVASHAGRMSSGSYIISNDVLSSGGGVTQSAGYSLQFTLGQSSPVGSSSSPSYINYAGFWHFLATPGDVNGDGVVDLTDVIRVLQVLTGQSGGQIYLDADINGNGRIGTEELIYGMERSAE